MHLKAPRLQNLHIVFTSLTSPLVWNFGRSQESSLAVCLGEIYCFPKRVNWPPVSLSFFPPFIFSVWSEVGRSLASTRKMTGRRTGGGGGGGSKRGGGGSRRGGGGDFLFPPSAPLLLPPPLPAPPLPPPTPPLPCPPPLCLQLASDLHVGGSSSACDTALNAASRPQMTK